MDQTVLIMRIDTNSDLCNIVLDVCTSFVWGRNFGFENFLTSRLTGPEFVDYYVGSLPFGFGSRAVEVFAFVGARVFLFRGFGVAREFDLGAVAGVEQNSILEPPFAGFYNPNFRRLAFDLNSSWIIDGTLSQTDLRS